MLISNSPLPDKSNRHVFKMFHDGVEISRTLQLTRVKRKRQCFLGVPSNRTPALPKVLETYYSVDVEIKIIY